MPLDGTIPDGISSALLIESIDKLEFESMTHNIIFCLISCGFEMFTDPMCATFLCITMNNLSINREDTHIELHKGLTVGDDSDKGLREPGKNYGDPCILESIEIQKNSKESFIS